MHEAIDQSGHEGRAIILIRLAVGLALFFPEGLQKRGSDGSRSAAA